MTDTIIARISIENATDPESRSVKAEIVDEAAPAARDAGRPPSDDRRELLMAHYAEHMNAYRYFGSLRAQIAWAPSIILVALISFIARDAAALSRYGLRFVVPCTVLGVFAVIFVANLYLQYQQQKSSNGAKNAQYHLLSGGYEDKDISFFRLRQDTRTGAPDIKSSRRPDKPSWCLLAFLALLLALQFLATVSSFGGLSAYWENEPLRPGAVSEAPGPGSPDPGSDAAVPARPRGPPAHKSEGG